VRPLNQQVAKSHYSIQQELFSQMAAIQLGNDNSADEASWRFDKGVKTKLLFIDFKKKGYMKAHITSYEGAP